MKRKYDDVFMGFLVAILFLILQQKKIIPHINMPNYTLIILTLIIITLITAYIEKINIKLVKK